MPTTANLDETIPMPALMRAARGSYAQSIRVHLEARGIDDLPRNGPFVLGGIANHGGSAGDLIAGLDVTKQAASQLIDTLVVRGYLSREADPADRRRQTIGLTERGREAARAIRAGIEDVDTELARLVSPAELVGLRAGLTALAEIKDRMRPHS
ncbi:MAG TPA: MarR family transcriptional regulator [Mycobacteriales bacterium]|jgi:DNA-binding MarR family transcriptional regulator|nr:MarR family transcriptional regulator [Mycobacteriales bacterium]